MKKRVAALAMAAVMCIGVTGCKKKSKPKCENFDLAEAAQLMEAEKFSEISLLSATLKRIQEDVLKRKKGETKAVYNTLDSSTIDDFLEVYPNATGISVIKRDALENYSYLFSFQKGGDRCMKNLAGMCFVFKTEKEAQEFFDAYKPSAEDMFEYYELQVQSGGSMEGGKLKERDDGLQYRCYTLGGKDVMIRFEEGTYKMGKVVIDIYELVALYNGEPMQINEYCDVLGLPHPGDEA